ncbi:MAG: glycosyltransferase family 2 protein [Oscillospiraceae bacterium]|nr:glycosyltransferase family 2 protein [Oscillospiraceae bacterium]
MKKFSIILPVCNAEKHIDKCIESIALQTYTNLEIILADNGLSEISSEICSQWAAKDSRIKTICCESSDVSSARNAGIAAASGDYIIFASADSIFDVSIMEKCMAEISAHSPDLLVCAIKAPSDDKRSTIFMDCNMYTRFEYTENIARYISTGIGFDTVTNKVFSAHIIKSRNLQFSEKMPLVEDELFNCRSFTIANHIRCVAYLLCNTDSDTTAKNIGTTEYLAQGTESSQKLIDAVQSKGLYGAASQAIGKNYQQILYRHLILLSAPNDNCNMDQRISALENLSQSSDYGILMLYLSTIRGIKNQYIYQMFKLRQWRMLISILNK